jgi:hypothetical protein
MAADASALTGPGTCVLPTRKGRDLLELAVGYGLILAVIWTPRPWQRGLYWVAILWLVLATCVSFDGWSEMGFRVSRPLRSSWVIGAALLIASIALAVGSRYSTVQLPGAAASVVRRYWFYAIWSFVQQFLLLDFVLLRLLRLLSEMRLAVFAAAALFALAHLPNPILTPLTFIWGLAACLLFLAYRNLYTLGIAHAILGICIAIVVPGAVDHNMRVGLGYLTYRQHRQHHRNQKDHIVSTEAWVMAEAPTRRC